MLHPPSNYLSPRNISFPQRGAGKSIPHACLEDNTTWELIADIEKLREHLEIPEWQVKFHVTVLKYDCSLVMWTGDQDFHYHEV